MVFKNSNHLIIECLRAWDFRKEISSAFNISKKVGLSYSHTMQILRTLTYLGVVIKTKRVWSKGKGSIENIVYYRLKDQKPPS